jgi:hypothetical protein
VSQVTAQSYKGIAFHLAAIESSSAVHEWRCGVYIQTQPEHSESRPVLLLVAATYRLIYLRSSSV